MAPPEGEGCASNHDGAIWPVGVRARTEIGIFCPLAREEVPNNSVDWRPPLNDVLRRERGAIQDPFGENASPVSRPALTLPAPRPPRGSAVRGQNRGKNS